MSCANTIRNGLPCFEYLLVSLTEPNEIFGATVSKKRILKIFHFIIR